MFTQMRVLRNDAITFKCSFMLFDYSSRENASSFVLSKKVEMGNRKILSIQKTLVDENDISLCVIKAWGGQKRVLFKLLVGVLARLIMANISLRKM